MSAAVWGERPWVMQGWFPEGADGLAAAMAGAGGLGTLRVPAFPSLDELRDRLRAARAAGPVGLDVKGLLGSFREVVEMARREGAAFLLHGTDADARRELKGCGLPRLALVRSAEEALQSARDGVQALVLDGGEALLRQLPELRAKLGLPVAATADGPRGAWREALASGLSGVLLRAPRLLQELLPRFEGPAAPEPRPLPPLRIRHLQVPYPIVQGGMGVGVSWDGLAGAVARHGCLGTVSAIGTGYRHPEGVRTAGGRPVGPEALNHGPALRRILADALRTAEGRGAVGVNVLCAIHDYDRVVRESVAGGAQFVISGAGLPLDLPALVGDAEVALIPIVSSARALRLLCRTWQRRHGRLPDAVVLEGPESGGHQGFSAEQCADPAYALEALLPEVAAERDAWGDFPVIAAGGVWDRADIDRLMALGAGGVQMGTRFVGTFECDADRAFKEVLLQARREDIRLMPSPVGMPARGVLTALQRRIAEGTAPPVRCVSGCLVPCDRGEGARAAGYCIADRLEDARHGDRDTGLFFSGSNGWRLRELVSVRELVGELTLDHGLEALEPTSP